MPTVPTFNSNVQARGLRVPDGSININQEAFGVGSSSKLVENATRNLLKTSESFYQEQKKNADQIAIQDYDSGLSQLQSSLQQKAESMRGRNAAGALEQVQEEWTKGINKLDQKLVNTDQKAMGNRAAQSRFDSLSRSVDTYTAVEFRKADDEETESYIKVQKDLAIQNYKDRLIVQDSKQKQIDALEVYQKRNGLSPDWLKSKSLESISKTNTDIVSRMSDNGEDMLAKAFFEANKSEFSAEDIGRVEKFVRAGSIIQESDRLASKFFSEGKSPTETLQMANDIVDVDLKNATKASIRDRYSENENFKNIENKQITENLYDELVRTKGQYSLSATQRVQLDKSVVESFDSARKRMISGEESVTDIRVYDYLSTTAADPKQFNDFKKINLLQLQMDGKLSITDYKQFKKAQEGDQEELNDYRTSNQIQDSVLKQAGIEKDSDKGRKFISIFTEQIRAAQRIKGSKLNNEEMEKIGIRMGTEVVLSSGWFGLNSMLGEVSQVYEIDPKDIDMEEIPTSDLADIKAKLTANKIFVNSDNIKGAYAAGLKRGVYRGRAN